MKSIESLARVDILCVDKTGTITANKMTVTDLILPQQASQKDLVANQAILSKYINTISDSNITMLAPENTLNQQNVFKMLKQSHFHLK